MFSCYAAGIAQDAQFRVDVHHDEIRCSLPYASEWDALRLQHLVDACYALATANAGGDESVLLLASLQFVQNGK